MIGNDVWLCSSWFKQKTQDGQKVSTSSKHKKFNICQILTHLKQIRSPMKEKSLFKPPQWHILIYQVPLAICLYLVTTPIYHLTRQLCYFNLCYWAWPILKHSLITTLQPLWQLRKKKKLNALNFDWIACTQLWHFFMTNGEKRHD